jgi:hypothetical protein
MKPKEDVAEWMAAIEEIKPDIHLDPFADIDSYTLMRQADVVVTYGSTTGVEAAFAGKPVVVMGPSAYDKLGTATGVSTASGVSEALQQKKPGSWSGAVSFGLMMMRRGFIYSHVKRIDSEILQIDGTSIPNSNKLTQDLSNIRQRLGAKQLLTGKWGTTE